MSLKLLAAMLAATCVLAFSSSTPNQVQADLANTPILGPGGATSTPTPYTGTNGGAEDLVLDFSQTGPATGTITVTGGTPGGSGLMAVSFAPANVQGFGISFLIATDPINLITFFYYGYDAAGSLTVPGVSQSFPNLAGTDTYIQAYEYDPGAKASNGLVFPLLP